ncbi:oligosaccharide flippase family protein [Desemzia incerta]|uniref:oligosaccharide flippase family protein n=1 Tax=Desemzia incerta TaxID=82801 RepID=UPI003314899E
MRSKKAFKNIISSLILQIVSIVTGLIVPNLIISFYGSAINGLVASITQFLGYITLLEAGVGGVTRAALYKPLSEKNNFKISSIMKATESFFKKIGLLFLGYLAILGITLPVVVKSDYPATFIFLLVLIMGCSTFFQYYFGITNQLLLQADQKQYIVFYLQSATMLINTILIVLFIRAGLNIHIVQIFSAIVFVFRPLMLRRYVLKNYNLIQDTVKDDNAIKQRWDGLGHHIANTVHSSTDVALITLFLNIKEVSVYSIYFLVVSGVKKISVTIFTGVESAFGNMLARKENENLNKNFDVFEFLTFSIVTVLFTSTGILIISFISIYTREATDVNYIRPVFAYILVLSEAIYCIRIPFNTIILAAGHYKQTRNGAFVEAAINIITSVILLKFLGIAGVAIGTLIAMSYRTIELVIYLSKNILQRNIFKFLKKVLIYSLAVIMICILASFLPSYNINSLYNWLIYATVILFISISVMTLIGLVFYRYELIDLTKLLKRIFVRS